MALTHRTVAMMIVMSVVEAGRRSGRGAYTIAVFPREERVRSQAYMRAARNVGYTLGASIALQYGLDYPEEVDGLVLMTVAARPKVREPGAYQMRLRALEDPAVRIPRNLGLTQGVLETPR